MYTRRGFAQCHLFIHSLIFKPALLLERVTAAAALEALKTSHSHQPMILLVLQAQHQGGVNPGVAQSLTRF